MSNWMPAPANHGAAGAGDGAGAGATSAADTVTAAARPRIGDFLAVERVAVNLEVGSRKRLFEQFARMVSARDGAPGLDDILATLIKREKLGCTGVGRGIALPHGRLDGLESPVIAAARLKNAIDYDAPDGQPVWLAVCLLVPVDATSTHLNILAALAASFSDSGFTAQLKSCDSAAELAACLGGIEVKP